MKEYFFVVAALLTGFLGGCSSPNKDLIEKAPMISVQYTDDMARDIFLRKPPKRIVSLSPGVTEMFFALGAGDLLVGRSQICDYPSEALDLPEVESYPMVDLKKIADLKPDMVITSSDVHQVDITRYFDGLSFPLFYLQCEGLEDLYRGIGHIANISNRQETGKQLVDSLSSIEKKITEATRGQIKYGTMVIAQVDSAVVVAGGKGLLNELVEKSGGKNVFADKDQVYAEVDGEEIYNKAPEFIFLATNDDQAYGNMIAIYPGLHLNLPASQNKQVFQLQPELLRRPTPRIMEGLATMARSLHSRINVSEFFGEESGSRVEAEEE